MRSKDTTVVAKKNKEQGVAPRLRFPDFVGEWESVPMQSLYEFKPTNSLSRDKLNFEYGDVRNIHYGDIHTKFSARFVLSNESVPYINDDEVPARLDPESYCAVGDMVFADASEDLDDIGKSIEIIDLCDEQVLAGTHTILARRTGDELVVGFGTYLFGSSRIRSQIQREAQGAKVLGISPKRLADVLVHYPGKHKEQQKIADCLSSLDSCIDAEIRKLDALKAHKHGLIQNLFPAAGQCLPQLRFAGFRGGWATCSLGSRTAKVGSGVTPTGGQQVYTKTGRPFVRSQNVGWGELLLDDVAFIDEKTHSGFSSTELVIQDVLLNITGASIGRSAIADARIVGGNVNQHVCIIRPVPSALDSVFLNQFLISQLGQKQIDSFQAGGNRQGLNFAQIRSMSISLPPTFREQKKISACVSSLDILIAAQCRKIAVIQQHRKGLMQGLFPALDSHAA